mgnify:CR=1 FL=1
MAVSGSTPSDGTTLCQSMVCTQRIASVLRHITKGLALKPLHASRDTWMYLAQYIICWERQQPRQHTKGATRHSVIRWFATLAWDQLSLKQLHSSLRSCSGAAAASQNPAARGRARHSPTSRRRACLCEEAHARAARGAAPGRGWSVRHQQAVRSAWSAG